jgi:hypothetical protein
MRMVGMLIKRLVKGAVSFYQAPVDQVASSKLITTMQVCNLGLLILHKMMKGIEVRIPSVKFSIFESM